MRQPHGPDSRRSRQQRSPSELRAQGRYGPELRDVLPAFVGLGLCVVGAVLLLAWFHRALGVGGLVLGVLLLTVVGAVVRVLRRPIVRRRNGRYTPAEIAVLDDRALKLATSRMLRRDGWQVTDVSMRDRPRLYARDARGRRLDVAFRPVATAAEEQNTPAPTLRWEAVRSGTERVIRVVIHPGALSRADLHRASHHGDVHLVDGRLLRRWANGATLEQLGLL
ncbi:hypothetical protein [Streptomyces sp. IBSBF 3136]|uniref:hypothetical protein n=1 Tax=Streptomyces sp. IBSBF 3136 TaxID=2903524 RepID=UPI002FDBAF12